MDARARLAIGAAVVAGAIVAALLAVGGEQPVPQSGAFPTVATAPPTPLPAECLELPRARPLPRWFPSGLPLPDGSYASELLDGTAGVRIVNVTVPVSLDDLVAFLLEEWPGAGWELGAGEREPGEAETVFSNEDTIGQIRARSVYCDADATLVSFAIADRRAR